MGWNQVKHLLSHDKTWTVVSAIAGMIAALAAMVAIWQTKTMRTQELMARSPYITFTDAGIKVLPESPPYRVECTMANVGTEPACDLEGKIFVVDSKLSEPLISVIQVSVGNDIANRTPAVWQNDTLTFGPEAPPFYLVLAIKYWDRKQKRYDQDFFMRWQGAHDGKAKPDFRHATTEQRQELKQRLHEDLQEFHGQRVRN
jgi:hypothetical protein